jgi:hypothetical protein
VVTNLWPTVQFAAQFNNVAHEVLGLFKNAGRVSVLIARVVCCQCVFGHDTW